MAFKICTGEEIHATPSRNICTTDHCSKTTLLSDLPGDASSLLTLDASPVAAPGVVSTGMRGSPRYCGVDGDQPPADAASDDVTMECEAGVRRGDEVTMEMGGCS